MPVYSVTKHSGFVPSLEYFKKQVFSRDVEGYKVVEPGDFAYATIHLDEGSIGIAPQRALISPMYTVFRADEALVDPEYLIRYLKSPRALAQYSRLGNGAIHRRKSISLDALRGLPVPLPPIDEQRRIAAILDRADMIRAKRRQVLEYREEAPAAVFRDMFAHEDAAGAVSEFANNVRTGPFGSQLRHGEFVDTGIAVLGLDNVVGNEFRWGARRYITPAKYEQLKRYTVAPGDVLISIMGTTGRCVVVPDDIPAAINTKHICAISVDRTQLEPTFLRAAFLWHPTCRTYLARQTKGSIMDGLNLGIIKSMPIPVPALTRQREFADHVAALDQCRLAVRAASRLDDELFASLQSRAFRGEL
ncbi:MAG: restriction endonuclease subunit S [Microbacterium sp. SCN 70-18]|nr:restriction endonuclease subunit S [Microbacterium chocolatum]ODT09283.1 MAG: restriction endonuclease subunit S [Microbacterium sp. SCN 70-18]